MRLCRPQCGKSQPVPHYRRALIVFGDYAVHLIVSDGVCIMTRITGVIATNVLLHQSLALSHQGHASRALFIGVGVG